MKTKRIYTIGIYLSLTACSVLLPQTAAPEERGVAAPGPGIEIVEEAIEVFPAGSASSEEEIGPTTVEIIGGDEAALREFVERWLGSTYPGVPADHITVYLGSLPPELSYDLPLPEDAVVIGSVRQVRFDNVQVILETSLPVEAALAFYEDSLPAAGWAAATNAAYGGGFVSSEAGSTYCLGEETSLNLQVGAWPSGATDVRIYTFSGQGYSPCTPDQQYGQDPVSALLPSLVSPPGAQMTSSGGGGSGMTDGYNEAHLITDLPAGEVAAHFNEQLIAAGWTPLESGGSEGHAWSTWSVTDEEGQAWSGTLVVLEVPPGGGTIFAYIRVGR